MVKHVALKFIYPVVLILSLSACGGGGGGGNNQAIGGGGVKGPMANAVVTVYAFDASQPGFKGAIVATASTDASAAITGLSLPFPVTPPYIMQFTSTPGITTDITTDQFPVINTLRTVITQSLLDGGEQIYATPLTTMAVDLAVANANSNVLPYTGNNDSTTSAAEFVVALQVAASQVVSTVGFGMSGDIDIFDVPPLVDNTTDTTAEQADVAAYRTAVEALTALVFQMEQQSAGGSVDAVLSELTDDLADGVIDGMVDGAPSTIFTSTTLDLLAQDPATLPIPNTGGQTVADVQNILVSETTTTGTTTSTTELGTSGSIITTTEPAETDPDSDGDGVPNAEDAFPNNPLETVDTDGDGIGDNADPDDDNNGILDVDEGVIPAPTALDTDGDGIPDTTDNCPAIVNTAQTNTDGNPFPDPGDACDTDDDDDGVLDVDDLFPLDVNEHSDTDGDGIGNNADTDDDNDGIDDATEDASGASTDHDGDGILNREDTDSDGDGYLDSVDLDPYNAAITINNAPVASSAALNTDEDIELTITLVAADDSDTAVNLVYAITSAPPPMGC